MLAKRAASVECKHLKGVLKSENLTQLIDQPTRVSKDSKTLLDIIATNAPHNIRKSGVESLSLSDHEMVYCIRKLNWMKGPSDVKVFRNYAKYDSNKFREELKSVAWDNENDSSGTPIVYVNELWTKFKCSFLTVADRHAPLTQKRVRGMDTCLWMNDKLKRGIRQRDYLLKKARKSNNDEDWSAYRCARNRLSNATKRAKQSYNKNLIEKHKDDAKSFWKTFKKILPGEKKSTSSKNIYIDGNLCTEDKKIANAFNSFFTTAIDRLKQSLSLSTRTIIKSTFQNKLIPAFKFESVDESFTLKVIKELKASKASGLDTISPRLLKDAAEVIAKPLTRIINTSLSRGSIPEEWKSARVTPLFKKGDATDMDNYRPISILSVASKVLERVVHHQLCAFLEEHQLLSPYQCGFRRKHSTETATIAFSDFIRRGMDQGLLTGSVFIDLRKAFDSIDHGVLLDKLEYYGLRETELDWFRSYLIDRKQVVKFGKETSNPCTITSGVPQGSILGPLLFVLFINDIPAVLKHCQILMYADDTVIYFSAMDATQIAKTLSDELTSVNRWLLDNSLFMHKGKTECVLFGTNAKLASSNDFEISVDGDILKRASEYKYLGVVLDECLSWNAHIKYLLSKAGKRIGMLGRAKKNISMNTASTIYKSFIVPIIDYCDTVWNCCGSINTDKIEKLQRRAARIIMGTNNSEEALQNLGYKILKDRRERHVFNLVNKCLIRHCPQFLNNYFSYNRNIVPRITRQSDQLRPPPVKLECTKKAFYYHGCIVFNRNT